MTTTIHSISDAQLLELFRSFTTDQWLNWLRCLLAPIQYGTADPQIAVGNEFPDGIIFAIYQRLGDRRSRHRLEEGLLTCFECVSPEKESDDFIFYLLHILTRLKPARAKQLLKKALLDEIYRNRSFSGCSLHQLLLECVGEFDPDDSDLVAYIGVSSRRIVDFDYILACFRVMSAPGGRRGYRLLNKLVKLAKDEHQFQQIRFELESEMRRLGCQYLIEWYTENWIHLIREDALTIVEGIIEELLSTVEDAVGEEQKDYVSLFLKQLESQKQPLGAVELYEIGALAHSVNEDFVVQVLTNIWIRERRIVDQPWLLTPWEYVRTFRTAENSVSLSTERDRTGVLLEDDQVNLVFQKVQTNISILMTDTTLRPTLDIAEDISLEP